MPSLSNAQYPSACRKEKFCIKALRLNVGRLDSQVRRTTGIYCCITGKKRDYKEKEENIP